MREITISENLVPNQRRRRKRNRPHAQQSGESAACGDPAVADGKPPIRCSANHQRSRTDQDYFYRDDDTRFAFLDKDGDDLIDGRARFRSLPILLEERRSGRWQSQQKRWQSEMLFSFTKKPRETYIGRRQWRGFAKRKIPFTQLGSPPSDAVLAMDRNADYLLSLGNMDNGTNTGLALRFYGIHSIAARQQSRNQSYLSHSTVTNYPMINSAFKAPLLQTTPLHNGMKELNQLHSPGDSIEHDEILNFHKDFSPSTTPVELLISNDWKVGVAMLYPSKNNGDLQINAQENSNNPAADHMASIVFFTLPQRQSLVDGSKQYAMRIFKCSNVPTFRNDSRRKLLWSVESIPNSNNSIVPNTTTRFSCDTYFRAPGYLLFLDEGDGLRLTWASEKYFLVSSSLEKVPADSRFASVTTSCSGDSIILSQQETPFWVENIIDDTVIGDLSEKIEPSSAQVSIVSESFLHLDVLLTEVLSRRKGISETHPEFCYSLISVNRGGRVAEFVVVFAREKKACSLGFFVKVDLFTGNFAELDWVQSKGRKDSLSLQKWCNTLAVNRRMREMRAGPFAVQGNYGLDCTRLCRETFTFDNDENDDYDESYWSNYVLDLGSEGQKTRQAPKLVTLASLYPCCDVISNQAIISFEPVMSIRAKESPIQLVYN